MSIERVNRVTCNGCGAVRYTPYQDRLLREPWPLPTYWTLVPADDQRVEPDTFCPSCNLIEAGKAGK